ncbi:tetratricopeptide repeat protein [Wenzhouxiangella sp. XN79A]|uniref:tetratricopeptide repeat-containing sulfotransferase family protein n=1 Tax=Wenzhouxiangella sp. XN79A TaxID=2724193 RepID=UPI00144A81BE|nr:sulfotransferase [Wenzhouxiangella sp. XN79A]NKI34261.1 tetratricopeptide repeat protein [Wenzhouxiangella sp. XN79A]
MHPTPPSGPPAPAAALRRAGACIRARRWSEAEAVLAPLDRPGAAGLDEIRRLRGVVAMGRGQPETALPLFESALELAPKRAVLYLNRGSCLSALDRPEAAETDFRHALKLERDLQPGWFNLGRLLLAQARLDEAASAFRQALRLKSDHAESLLCLGHVLKALADIDGSVAAYRRGVSIRPGSGDLWWALANVKVLVFQDDDIDRLRAQIELSTSDVDRIGLHFALATALESKEKYDEAFRHFEAGNRIKRRQVQYDAEARSRQGARIRSVFSPELLENVGRVGALGEGSDAPIFIVSLPRSGSTLIEQILSSHPDCNGASELPDLGRLALKALGDGTPGGWSPERVRELDDDALAGLGRDYLQRTARWSRGHARFTDKMPNNFPLAGLIALILPNARIVNCVRDPVDTGLSCYRQLFARGHHWSYDLDDIAAHTRYFRALTSHWEQVLPGRFLTVRYEELLDDFEAQARCLVEFCGLPWDPVCLRFHENRRPVRTASAGQVRQKLNRAAVGRWKHYADRLGPLIALYDELC